jgi:hypothetical protein
MRTSTFSSSLRYASLFLASSVLHLLHNMLLHACITHNHNTHLLSVLCFYILYAPSASLMHNASACSLQSLFFPNRLFTAALPHTRIAPQQNPFLHSSTCLSHIESSHDHHHNSSSSLAVLLPVSSSSVVVMLRFLSLSGSRDSSSSLSLPNLFIITGRYPEIPWLIWQSRLFVFSVDHPEASSNSLCRNNQWFLAVPQRTSHALMLLVPFPFL